MNYNDNNIRANRIHDADIEIYITNLVQNN